MVRVFHLFHRKSALVASLALLMSGCTTLGPDYHAPRVDVPSQWHEASKVSAVHDATQQAALRTWWRAFHDPVLDRLVDTALARNQDLAIARTRLTQARAERVQVAAGLGPNVSVGGMGQALRSSERLDWPPGIGESRTWRAGFDASWELDIFGGTQRAVEAADAHIEAVADDAHAVQVSLLAELAADYAMLRTAQARSAIAQENIRNLLEGERLAERALAQGLGTSADVAQARAERETAQALPPLLDADIARLSHAIGVLTGGFSILSSLSLISSSLLSLPSFQQSAEFGDDGQLDPRPVLGREPCMVGGFAGESDALRRRQRACGCGGGASASGRRAIGL
jgi:outer membrane protein TolC